MWGRPRPYRRRVAIGPARPPSSRRLRPAAPPSSSDAYIPARTAAWARGRWHVDGEAVNPGRLGFIGPSCAAAELGPFGQGYVGAEIDPTAAPPSPGPPGHRLPGCPSRPRELAAGQPLVLAELPMWRRAAGGLYLIPHKDREREAVHS